MSEGTSQPRHGSGRARLLLLLFGVGVVVGPAAVVLTVASLSWLVLDLGGGTMAQVLGIIAFLGVAAAIWYGAGRVGGAVAMRFGGSPFAALAVLSPALLFLAYVTVASADGLRVVAGMLVFLLNAFLLVVLGIRAAEQSLIRRSRG